MSETLVDTKGIEPWRVFKALYDRAKAQGMGFLHYTPEDATEAAARKIISEQDYFDYVGGRVMKVSLKNPDGFNPRLYDRDNGDGAAEAAIAPLRSV